jgi:hypothetical protein
MTVSVCALASLLSAASPTVSYRFHAGSQAVRSHGAPEDVARVQRITRQGSINGRGQVWRSSDVRLGSPTTAAPTPTTAPSFLTTGK